MSKTVVNDPTIPLNKDELSDFCRAFGIPEQSALDQMKDSFSDAIKKLIAQNNDIMRNHQLQYREMMNEFAGLIKALTTATLQNTKAIADIQLKTPMKENPIFYSSFNKDSQEFWKTETLNVILKECENNAGYDFDTVYKMIIDGMNRDGYDVIALLTKHHEEFPDASLLDMCSKSDVLRLSLRNQVNHIFHTRVVKQYKKVVENLEAENKTNAVKKHTYHRGDVTYDQAHTIPAEVRDMVKRLAKKDSVGPATYHSAKKFLVDECHVDIPKLVDETVKKYNISSCNMWFAVGQYPEVLNMLKKHSNYVPF